MKKRRQFLKITFGFLAGLVWVMNPFFSFIQTAHSKLKKVILPKGTRLSSLVSRNPAELDTRNLEIEPVKDFETMGTSDYEVDLGQWRLRVSGKVEQTMHLTYEEILGLPAIERNVLLICPGVFVNHGRWKGVSMKSFFEKVKADKEATHMVITGPPQSYEKTERFPIKDVLTDKVFLAYGVNGEPLPKKHGFPLRIVAEDYYGDDWVKYVFKVDFVS